MNENNKIVKYEIWSGVLDFYSCGSVDILVAEEYNIFEAFKKFDQKKFDLRNVKRKFLRQYYVTELREIYSDNSFIIIDYFQLLF